MTDDPSDSIDLECAAQTRVGVTRGETSQSIGPPRDYPDRADISIGPGEPGQVSLTIDAMAGDHGTGHADLELTLEEARTLCGMLEETVRWMSESSDDGSTDDPSPDEASSSGER